MYLKKKSQPQPKPAENETDSREEEQQETSRCETEIRRYGTNFRDVSHSGEA